MPNDVAAEGMHEDLDVAAGNPGRDLVEMDQRFAQARMPVDLRETTAARPDPAFVDLDCMQVPGHAFRVAVIFETIQGRKS